MKTKFCALFSFFLPALIFLSHNLSAQNIGIGTTTPDPSAILDITSTDKGVLLPRLTLDQRNAIASPAAGLLIYQTDFNRGFYYYLGGWQSLTASSSAGANTSLSNLQAPTSVNTDLLPLGSASFNLGSSSLSWKDIYFFGDVYLAGTRYISNRGTNSFFGNDAGNPSTTAFYNTALGNNALSANITGSWNTANGYQALMNTNGGYNNTAIGYQTLFSNVTGTHNSATGVLALSSNATGSHNSATGAESLWSSTGNYNSAIGYYSGGKLPSGNNNTFLGALADVPFGVSVSNATAIGFQAQVTGSNSVRVGNTAVNSIGGYAGWTTFPSDGRFKRNIKENVPGLQFINQLRAVTYNIDVDAIDKALQSNVRTQKRSDALDDEKEPTAEEIKSKQEKAAITHTGFIAQEVEQAAKRLAYNFSGVDVPKSGNGLYGLRYGEFVVPLVKAVQELDKKIDDLQKENSQLKTSKQEIEIIAVKQQAQIDNQQQQIDSLKTLMVEMQKEMAVLNAQKVAK